MKLEVIGEAPNFRRITEDLLASREMLLWKQLHSGKKTPSFYKRLAYWTLDCIGIHAANQPDKREEWARILQITEPAELFMIDKEEFFDMYGYIHREITMPGSIGMGSGYTYSQEVLKHINWMKHILDLGPTGYMMEQIGGPSNSYEIKSDTSSEPELEEELLLLEKQIIEEDVPTIEPKRADYPLSMDWLRARAKWTRTQTIRDKLYIVRATLEAKKKTEEIKKRENDTNQQTIIRLRSLMNLGTAS